MRVRAPFGGRLFLRFYLFQVLIIALAALSILVAWRQVIQPGKQREEGAIVYLGEWALRQIDRPAQLQRELDSMESRFDVKISVYTAEGNALVHEGAPAWSPLQRPTLERLKLEHVVTLPDQGVAVGAFDAAGQLVSYALVSLGPEQTTRPERAIRVLGLVLVFFALGTIPLVRSIARPLERLSDATRAFGAGNLRARARLERRDEIGDLAQAFDEMADGVEAFRRAEKELLANVSHELRSPLARIRVVSELAADRFPAVAQRYMAEIGEDLSELERLIDDIISTARLDLTGTRNGDPNPPLRFALVPVGAFVATTVRRFAQLHPERHIDCKVDHEPSIFADPILLRRAIGNVLDNAHKYSSDQQAISVRVECDKQLPEMTITIQDYGVGIDEADLTRVLMPFFRTDRSRARNTGGIGLGLSLTKRIVEAHGGSIRLRSKPNEGTSVSITLPLADGEV